MNVPLRVLPPDVHGGDRWIQDEVEFAFSESPTHSIAVVCDSPRDRELRNWAAMQVGPDLGHFQMAVSRSHRRGAAGRHRVLGGQRDFPEQHGPQP